MPYSFLALISVALFCLVHLFAEKTRKLPRATQGIILSTGGGVAIAYVFIDLLPKLAKSELVLHDAFGRFFPYFERHVYILALAGFLLFYIVDQSHKAFGQKGSMWLSLCSYALFNFFVGYAVCDKANPEVQPLVLFTIAMGLHYFVNDFSISKEHPNAYGRKARYILMASLFAGWALASIWQIPASAVALVSAFIGGGVIMNVIRHELPKDNPHSLGAFLFGAVFYSALLLTIG
ncbi:MAG: hypothetical protein LLF94_07135 [Chlamydiales bacterium]|nr:hypothetical protein [Chlamydiales bacterium]